MKKTWSYLYIFAALLLLLTPSLGMALFGASGEAANEHLSPPPSLRTREGGFNPQVLNESADYLADHFALRQEMVTLWGALNATLGSSAQEQVILGREGWLYYAPTLADYTRSADVLVLAVGRSRMITGDMVKPGAAVIDVGINRVDGRLCGDVDFDGVAPIAGYITPVPGGVGPMTVAMLMENTLEAACRA